MKLLVRCTMAWKIVKLVLIYMKCDIYIYIFIYLNIHKYILYKYNVYKYINL